tara:strand:- start:3411 stop:4256 length:846 start_codon:yes stop_codon:yes gene_type:complete
MNPTKFLLKSLPVALAATMMSPVWADGEAETGPAKAAKQSTQFTDYLDREEVLGGKFSTWVEFASDYVFRGESETNDGKIPSLKAAVTWSHSSGLYLGYYAANNLFPSATGADGDNENINAIYGPYIGYATKDIAGTGINLNSMLFQYIYPSDTDSNYLEMFNYIDKQFGIVNIKLEYSPTITDWFGVEGVQSHNVAIHPSISLPYDFTLSGGVGRQMFESQYDADWTHWNVGISRNVFGFNVDVRYHDTDIKIGDNDFYGFEHNNQIVDSRVMFAVSKSF